MTGAYARIRRQFKLPIGKFEGVQEAMARIAGGAYTLEATRRLTASAGDMGVKPAVVSAIAKYHMTERGRAVVNDAMDVHSGRSIIFGPRNYLGYAYQAMPVAITVEGANILTRNLMIFGQGAIRCHPYVFAEMEAARDNDLDAFDSLFFGHVGYSINRGVRAFTLGLTGARFVPTPQVAAHGAHYRQLTRMSTALAFVSDVAMAVLGGDLKRRERLSARLGDVLSNLYLASAVLKHHYDAGHPADEQAYVQWSVEHCLAEIYKAFDEFFDNFPNRVMARGLRFAVFPLGRPYKAPADDLGQELAKRMMEPGGVRDRLTEYVYIGKGADDPTGRMEIAFDLLTRVEPAYEVFEKAVAKGRVEGYTFEQRLACAVERDILSQADADRVAEYERYRYDAILTDAFDKDEFRPRRELETPTRSQGVA